VYIRTASVDLTTGWNKLWSAISSAAPTFFNTLAVIGVALIVFAVLGWIWRKWRGGANSKNLMWGLAIGAVLAGPQLIIPAVLKIIEIVITIIVGLLKIPGGS